MAWGVQSALGMFNDLRLAMRGLIAQPGFTLVTIATLALGIGANTSIFTFVNAAWLRPLPVAEPGRLVVVDQARSYPDLRDLAESNRSLTGLVAHAVSRALTDLELEGLALLVPGRNYVRSALAHRLLA